METDASFTDARARGLASRRASCVCCIPGDASADQKPAFPVPAWYIDGGSLQSRSPDLNQRTASDPLLAALVDLLLPEAEARNRAVPDAREKSPFRRPLTMAPLGGVVAKLRRPCAGSTCSVPVTAIDGEGMRGRHALRIPHGFTGTTVPMRGSKRLQPPVGSGLVLSPRIALLRGRALPPDQFGPECVEVTVDEVPPVGDLALLLEQPSDEVFQLLVGEVTEVRQRVHGRRSIAQTPTPCSVAGFLPDHGRPGTCPCTGRA